MGKGKRSRRNQKRQSKGGKGNNNNKASPYPTTDDSTSTTEASAAANQSVLLQRIRHADPRTRHAALAAVANTLLDTTATNSSSTKKTVPLSPKLSPPLLQAIRERVLDADLDVCQVAAGCLANYVTLLASSTTKTSTQEQAMTMTAGWTLVLVGRLKHCFQTVTQMSTTTSNDSACSSDKKSNASKQNKKQQKQWLALALQCLRTLCVLVESNPQAIKRLTSSLDKTPRQDFHQTLLEWLQYGQEQIIKHKNTNNNPTTPTINTTQSVDYEQQIMILAARTLHSAWDDNAELLLPWMQECPQAFTSAMELLQSILQVSAIPVVAQLHVTGAFLAARPFVANTMTTTTSSPSQSQQQQQQVVAAQTTIQHVVIPLLTRRLSSFQWTTVQSLLDHYRDTLLQWDQEQADDALERDVIRKVHDRNEPARSIAKRQKEQRDTIISSSTTATTTTTTGMNNKNNTIDTTTHKEETNDKMEEDNNNNSNNNDKLVETREALERARADWDDFLLPLQLSLELLTNLTSHSSSENEHEHDDEDDMMMMEEWGPEQEAQWMQEQQKQQQTTAAGDKDLQKTLVESPLPQQLLQLFRQVYQLPSTVVSFPEQSRQDIEELQSKTLACLGNCWENSEAAAWPLLDLTWQELQQAAVSATGVGKEALVSALVIALKTYPSLRKQWQPEHLAAWLQELQALPQYDMKDKKEQHSALSIRRDAIGMLGVLCTLEPHPLEVNRQVCAGLLQAMTTFSNSLMIQCEVLNVLMDMYGNDEEDGLCYPSVFESLQVLSHFQRCIPTLKTKLKEQERKMRQQQSPDDSNADMVELEQWKEIILNASRFVQYKKGQL